MRMLVFVAQKHSKPKIHILIVASNRSIHSRHSTWYPNTWSEVDSTELLTVVEVQLDQLAELPRTIVSGWDLYQHTLRQVTTVRATAPVLERLKRYNYVHVMYV